MFTFIERGEILSKLPDPAVGPCRRCTKELNFAESLAWLCKCSEHYCHPCWTNQDTWQCIKCGAKRASTEARIAYKANATHAELLITKARKSICDLAKGKNAN